MRKTTITFLLLCAFIPAFTQTDSLHTKRVGVGYFSEGGFYPGLIVLYERTLLNNNAFELLLAGKAGFYAHYRNHTGVFISIQSGQRFRLHKHLFFEHFLGVGYLHTFLNGGDLYYVDAAGQVHRARNSGNPHFMPSVSLGLSYDIIGAKRHAKIFTRPVVFWQIPFNKSSLVQYGIEMGAMVTLKR